MVQFSSALLFLFPFFFWFCCFYKVPIIFPPFSVKTVMEMNKIEQNKDKLRRSAGFQHDSSCMYQSRSLTAQHFLGVSLWVATVIG